MTWCKTDIKQIVGRILRKQPNERTIKPLVIDISDEFSTFPQKTFKRIKYYSDRDYDISYFNVDSNGINPNITIDNSYKNNNSYNKSNYKSNYNYKPKRKKLLKFND